MLKFVGKQHLIEICFKTMKMPISHIRKYNASAIGLTRVGQIFCHGVYSSRLAGDPQGGLVLE